MSKYAGNKPECKDCSYCDKKGKCSLGKENCYYLLEEPKKEEQKEVSPCHNCPYGKGHEFCFPCWKNILGQKGGVANA